MVKAAMASSQVETATASPFGCAHVNRRDSACFQNDLNNLVSASCTSSISKDHHNNNNSNNSPCIDFTDLWVHRPRWHTPATTAPAPTKNNDNHSKKDYIRSEVIEAPNSHQNHYNDNKRGRTRQNMVASAKGSCSHHNDTKKERTRQNMVASTSAKGNFCDSSLVEVPNLGGVSSLVQKWRGFEAEAKSSGRNNNSSSSSSTPTTTCQDAPAVTNEDDPFLFGDWESDMTTVSAPSSSRGRESDDTESERLRVSEIIRKLTEDNGPDSSSRARISLDQSFEQRCLSPLIGSPRIRGRQAYNDLLIQMERDRRKELEGLIGRKAVTKFSLRGRIQALLRIRFLRRGMEANCSGRGSDNTSSESLKAMQAGIDHSVRERVDPSFANGLVHTGSCRKKLTHNNPTLRDLHTAERDGKENRCQQVIKSASSITSEEHNNVEHSSPEFTKDMEQSIQVPHNHEASSLLTFTSQGTSWDSGNHSLVESSETVRNINDTDNNSAATMESLLCSIKTKTQNQETEVADQQVVTSNYDLIGECDYLQSYQEGEPASDLQDLAETATYCASDISHPEVGWEELHTGHQQEARSNGDWIDEVSRPRSDWEGLRQARYQEMLDPFSDNEEIRVLLGRSVVSTFLSSGLREKVERVMMLRAQGQETLKNSRKQEGKHVKSLPLQEQTVVTEEGEGNDRVDGQEEEEDYGGYFDEYEEAESSVGQQYNESEDFIDYIPSSPARSWAQNQGRELSDCSYHARFPSYSAHPAIDMELIYDLRKHMEQLHQEMSQLRRSIKCCMDMQIKLQRSIKKEVTIALNHSDAKNGRQNSVNRVKAEGRCCVCSKMQVDSLLYRCGHMCTCYKCAHQLQLSSKECPICAAPIIDVVRAYYNHS